MSKRLVLALAGLVIAGGAAVPALADPVPTGRSATMPPTCPPHPLVWIANGNLYVQQGCLAPIVVPLPGIVPPPTH